MVKTTTKVQWKSLTNRSQTVNLLLICNAHVGFEIMARRLD